jgi:hypothetical protein
MKQFFSSPLRSSWLALTIAAALVLAVIGVSPPDADAQPRPKPAAATLRFEDHRKQLHEATHEQYKHLPGVKVASAAHFNEMKAHLLRMHKDLKVTHTFLGHDGHPVDVVAIDHQPSLRHPLLKHHKVQHTPPHLRLAPKADKGKHLSTKVRPLPPHLAKGMKDQHGHEMYAPAGHIAVRRLTLAEMVKHRTLHDFLQKHGGKASQRGELKPELVDAGGTTHRYGHAYQGVANLGGASWLNLWAPAPVDHGFALSQVWYTGGSPLQTLEGGWQVYPDKYGHNKPVLFIYWTADGYNKTGAYNLDSPGFIQVNNSFVIGGAWNQVSSDGGAQWGFRLVYYRDPATGNWWLYIQGAGELTAIGYYPKELYGDGQLSRYATEIDYGGEVTGNSGTPVITGQMGSGQSASAGWQHAAFQKEIYYFPTSGNSAWANLTGDADTGSGYSVDVHDEAADPTTWGTYFFFGGAMQR